MANIVGNKEYIAANPELFLSIFQQNWENVRNIRSERQWFMNTYAVITAGVLSLLQSVDGEFVLQMSLISSMCFLSLIGLVTSLRLKDELEECLEKVHTMAARAQLDDLVAFGQLEHRRSWYPVRWVFPILYSMGTALFVALFFYQLALGART